MIHPLKTGVACPSCHHEFDAMIEYVVCAWCETEFRFEHGRHRFCSRDCQIESYNDDRKRARRQERRLAREQKEQTNDSSNV